MCFPVKVVYECSKINRFLTIKHIRKMSTIYLASSWRNELQPTIVKALRENGHIVYDFRNPGIGKKGFAWSDIDKDWKNWDTEAYVEALSHPIADAGFKNDFEAMQLADTCVLLLPCGRSANAEAGWMKGAGKRVYVLQMSKEEPELMYKMYDGIFDMFTELLRKLRNHENS